MKGSNLYVGVQVSMTLFLGMGWALTELQKGREDPTRDGWNADTLFCILLGLLMITNIVKQVWEGLPQDTGKQTKILTYLVELSVGTLCFISLGSVSVKIFLVGDENCNVEMTRDPTIIASSCVYQNRFLISTTWTALCGMYLFEMILQGNNMRLSLMCHHLSAIALVIVVLYLDPSTTNITIGLIHSLFATMEQPTFVALLWSKLRPGKAKTLRWLFFFAWTTFALTKIISHWLALVVFIRFYDTLQRDFIGFYIVFATLVACSQLYSVVAQISICRGYSRKVARGSKVNSTPDQTQSNQQLNQV